MQKLILKTGRLAEGNRFLLWWWNARSIRLVSLGCVNHTCRKFPLCFVLSSNKPCPEQMGVIHNLFLIYE